MGDNIKPENIDKENEENIDRKEKKEKKKVYIEEKGTPG